MATAHDADAPDGVRHSASITPARWTGPLPLATIFPRRRPLEVDLGCGKGRFLLARAAAHPETDFLGLDRLPVRLRKLDRRIARRQLDNVRILRVEGAFAVQYLLPPTSVSVCYIFFPDPWPKRRHHRRRLFNPEFVERLNTCLVPGGLVHIATDHADYALAIQRQFRDHAGFAAAQPFIPPQEEQTDFERLFTAGGAVIHRCSYRSVPAPPRDA